MSEQVAIDKAGRPHPNRWQSWGALLAVVIAAGSLTEACSQDDHPQGVPAVTTEASSSADYYRFGAIRTLFTIERGVELDLTCRVGERYEGNAESGTHSGDKVDVPAAIVAPRSGATASNLAALPGCSA